MDAPSLIEAIRFGYGPKAGTVPAPGGLEPDRLLAQLTATDPAAAVFDRPPLADRLALIAQSKVGNPNITPDSSIGRQLKAIELADVATFVSRPAVADLGFVERLVNLWANRITVASPLQKIGHFIQSFRDEAVRPNIAGRYADLLQATIWHPAMQVYLTQTDSIGPNSPYGLRKAKGLNENLAREFLELHAMGHGYTQTDVTELAKLLAGMAYDETGPHVIRQRAEPGAKTVLGARYGEGITEIARLIEAVAHRAETADAVAYFIARHFIADVPPPDLVAALSVTYLAHDTQLIPLYRTLLQHPAAAGIQRQKIRSPQEYAAASLRLMGLSGQEQNLPSLAKGTLRPREALTAMGQPPFKALRPDGWPEVAAGWMTPPMIAARIDWAVAVARATGDRADPVELTDFALGDLATPQLRRAVAGAEQRWEGLAVLLASPDFSRR